MRPHRHDAKCFDLEGTMCCQLDQADRPRAEALAAEVEQLRQVDVVTKRALDVHLDIAARLEAARDHLRARLRDLKRELLRADQRQESVSPPTLKEWAADLLAILEAPSEQMKDIDARVGTMGDGDTSRTASAVQAGSEEPITLNQERNKP